MPVPETLMRMPALILLLSTACAFPEPPGSAGGGQAPKAAPTPADAGPREPGRPPEGQGPRGPEGGAPPEGDEHAPGIPTDGEDAPPAGDAGPPAAGMGMRCERTEVAVDPDAAQGMATLSGTVDWQGSLTGSVLVDIGGAADLSPRYGFECRGTGAFSVEVPRALGEVVVLVFIDNDMDGPTAADPQVRSEGSLDLAKDHTGLVLTPVADAPIEGATFATPPEE